MEFFKYTCIQWLLQIIFFCMHPQQLLFSAIYLCMVQMLISHVIQISVNILTEMPRRQSKVHPRYMDPLQLPNVEIDTMLSQINEVRQPFYIWICVFKCLIICDVEYIYIYIKLSKTVCMFSLMLYLMGFLPQKHAAQANSMCLPCDRLAPNPRFDQSKDLDKETLSFWFLNGKIFKTKSNTAMIYENGL